MVCQQQQQPAPVRGFDLMIHPDAIQAMDEEMAAATARFRLQPLPSQSAPTSTPAPAAPPFHEILNTILNCSLVLAAFALLGLALLLAFSV